MIVRWRLLILLAAASTLFASSAASSQPQLFEPTTAFTARRINLFNVATNVIASYPANVEGTPLRSSNLYIKEGTSDRAVLEFDIRGLATADVARLRFELGNIDRPRYTPLQLYSFDGNGVANAADFYRIDHYITSFTDNGVAAAPTYSRPFTLDVTAAFNQAVAGGHEYLGLVIRNQIGGSTGYARYLISAAPQLIVGIPEPTTAALCTVCAAIFALREPARAALGCVSAGVLSQFLLGTAWRPKW